MTGNTSLLILACQMAGEIGGYFQFTQKAAQLHRVSMLVSTLLPVRGSM
jgi:hypothetical protein